MAKSQTKDQTTKLENSTFNTYISDAQKDNNSELENMWNTIKEDRKRHMEMLRKALEKEAKEEKLSQ